MPRGRYAPSPTGWLHLGNARTALIAWWRARATGGSFVLRVEDLDAPRTVPEAVAGNLQELRWLGLDWDEGPDMGGPHAPYRQSERFGWYEAALERLRSDGRLFECWLSRKDLRDVASAPHGATPVYGPRERLASESAAARKRAEGKAPSLRLRVGSGTVAWRDSRAGRRSLDLESEVGDVVVRRADGQWAYALAVVVDDAAMRVGEVVRGDDLLQATGAQLALYDALGLEPPAFAHVPLLSDPAGVRLAKRRGDLTLRELRAAGVRPERVVGLLASTLGLLPARVEASASELVPGFELERLPAEATRLDEGSLAWLHGDDPPPAGRRAR